MFLPSLFISILRIS